MSCNRALALFLIALLFTTSNPWAHCQLIPPIGLSVGGNLCCTPTGNCPGQGVVGALVSLNCSILGATTTFGQATTNINGSFNVTIPALTGLILGLPIVPCVASVQLPLNSLDVCPVLSTTNGVIVSTIRSLGTIVRSTLGLVQKAALDGFVNVGL